MMWCMADTIVEIHIPLTPTPGLADDDYPFPWLEDVEEFVFSLDGEDGESYDDGEEHDGHYMFDVWNASEESLLAIARQVAALPGVPSNVFAIVTDSDRESFGEGRRINLS